MKPNGSLGVTLIAISLGVGLNPVFAQGQKSIGEVTALIAEASDADEASELIDGQSGDTDFPFITAMKPIATVGEIDKANGLALTGYPDGHAAWLVDENTVRVAYQSESYATMSSQTYGWEMSSGVLFTGSHIHTLDYDREGLAEFLNHDRPASEIFLGSGKLFDRVFNVFGDEVKPRADGGVWGNQARPDQSIVEFTNRYQLSEGDFFFQSFCGAHYEAANRYGEGVGFADDVWLTSEEWNIQRMFAVVNLLGKKVREKINVHDTMGLASVVVDIESGTAYTVPALGQTGYEKILPINPGHPDYVVLVLAGYNHGVEPAPLRVYIGRKGLDANGNPLAQDAPERDRFLARNGLLFGKIYGMAVANGDFQSLGIATPDPATKMLDEYIINPNAPETFEAKFFSTSYQWGGWDAPVSVANTEMNLWQSTSEQPMGYTFLNAHTKTEHPAVDPDPTRHRYVQNLTHKGGVIGVDFSVLPKELDSAGGGLPEFVSAKVVRIVGAYDGALKLEIGAKGLNNSPAQSQAVWKSGKAATVAPDGLQWIKARDGDVLILDEDSGNEFGERKMAIPINSDDLSLSEQGKGFFLAMAGGTETARAKAGVGAYPNSFSGAVSSEFSASWNLTSMLAKTPDGEFYSRADLANGGFLAIEQSVDLNQSTVLSVVQHRSNSGGDVAKNKADRGGQLFVFRMDLGQ